ncbi:uncharacterized protein LOC132044271 [Lycium ferocissimum]|uniref:uncharacterized protein LOC132044271 n=1 Tax=Lycium ferocissimum TaxID=112874 RepID=UPI0028156B3B|nr:uncharacterized protein LOC132044271 [Lycium ferocissimum]
MRPISLSNFINKVLSVVIHDKLEAILRKLFYPNPSGFVKGRNIIENVLLTQEIVSDIRLRGKPTNVILKIDMTKAYDIVSWLFLTKAYGFFHSSRRFKQDDPLSPALFILAAEVLSRSLNSLFDDKEFKGFGMPKWIPQLNHLAYADDTIIFSFADSSSLKQIIETLCGTANVWYDNWIKIGALYYVLDEIDESVEDIKELMLDGGWNLMKLQQLFPADIVSHITTELDFTEV